MAPSRMMDISCPRCAAPLRLSREGSISWNEKSKEFEVSMKGICLPCGFSVDLGVQGLPLTIAKGSSCSCGGSLKLADHSFVMKGGDLDFRATYRCSSCNKHEMTLLSRLISGLKQVWRDTSSVEVGLSGVKYGKRTSSDP